MATGEYTLTILNYSKKPLPHHICPHTHTDELGSKQAGNKWKRGRLLSVVWQSTVQAWQTVNGRLFQMTGPVLESAPPLEFAVSDQNAWMSRETERECTAEEDLSDNVYNTRNTYIQQAIKMFPHKIWLNVWLYNTFSTNLTRLLVPLVNPFIWCFVRIRTPVFFNFIGPVRDESWSATVITWPWKKTENRIMQAQLDSLICVTPAPLSPVLIYQNEVFTAKEHIQNLILIKTGIWNWYCMTLNSNNHISYKKYEISTCSLTNQTHTHKSVPKKKPTTKTV